MFHQLIESGTRRRRRTGWALASTGVHAILVASAITLTLEEASLRIDDEPSIPPIYFAPQVPTPPVEAPTRAAAIATGLQAPTRIPIELPAIPQVSLPLEQQPRIGGEPAIASGGLGIGVSPDTVDGRVYTPEVVERAVVPRRGNGQPLYPAKLRNAAVEGDVLVQFVVDTSGRVEPRSVEIMRATHEMFADAVRRWLVGTRYRAAEIRGKPVRQLVQQQIGFTLR